MAKGLLTAVYIYFDPNYVKFHQRTVEFGPTHIFTQIYAPAAVHSRSAVFKLGPADQRGAATGSHGVRERISKSSNCLHGF